MRLFLILGIVSAPAWNCSCDSFPSAKEAWLESTLVFAGRVEKTALERAPPEQTAWVRVTEPFKGVELGQVVEVWNQFGERFHDGRELVFYLFPGAKPGTWIAPYCHRTRGLDGAPDDLKFLRELPASAVGNRVSGVVSLWNGDDPAGQRRVFSGVRVRAIGPNGSHTTFTDQQGLYEFRNLEPGAYVIKVDYPSGMSLYLPIAYGKKVNPFHPIATGVAQVEVTADSGEGIDFALAPRTRISGRVLDWNGHPMQGVCIEIERLDGSFGWSSPHSPCTAPDGSYRISHFSPGTYRVVANRNGRASEAVPFAWLYHPGTSEREKARVVTVAAGQHANAIDFQVSEQDRVIVLSGQVTFSDGVPVARQLVRFREKAGSYEVHGYTDYEGSFIVQISRGVAGSIRGEILMMRPLPDACPQFEDGLVAGALLRSTPQPVAGDKGLSGIRVVFPIPSCKAWLEQEEARRKRF